MSDVFFGLSLNKNIDLSNWSVSNVTTNDSFGGGFDNGNKPKFNNN